MKKIKLFGIALATVLSASALASCQNGFLPSFSGGIPSDAPSGDVIPSIPVVNPTNPDVKPSNPSIDVNAQIKQIYNLALKSGYTGTYEEWLESIKGEQIELRCVNGIIEWKYQSDTTWTALININDLIPNGGDAVQQTHNVTFVLGGNLQNKVVPIKHNDYIPSNLPTREGYKFLGWYVGEDKWRIGIDVVTRDITLTAKWEKIEPERPIPAAELKTASMFGGSDPHAGVYNRILESYASEKNIKINDNSSIADETWKNSILRSFENGTEADVIYYFNGRQAEPFVSKDKVVPISEIQREFPQYAKNIDPAFSDPYCVTIKGMTEGFYVNTDLFTGDLAPYIEKNSWSWDEFMDISTKLQASGIIPVALGAEDIPHYWIEHTILAVNGPEAFRNIPTEAEFNAATGEGNTSADGWIKALKLFNVAKENGAFGYTNGNENNQWAIESFLQGRAAMYLDGSWYANYFDNSVANHANVKMYPFPTYGDNTQPYVQTAFTSGFYITRKAWNDPAKRQLAVDFVMKNTTTAAITDYCTAAFGIPSDTSVNITSYTPLQKSIVDHAIRYKDHATMPLSDIASYDSFKDLVYASDYFLKGDLIQIKSALASFAKKQHK